VTQDVERTPAWVKVFGVVTIVVVVVFAVLLVVGGDHGPSRHSAPPHSAVGFGE
jgi:ABC-type transporter Mla subunit MlaD